MKKKLFIFFLISTMIISLAQYHQYCKAIAPGIGIGITESLITSFDSLVAAYGATKGLQFGSSITEPQIIGDYTKPYTYSDESITGLRPLWDTFSDDYVRDNWGTLFPSASSYEDALLQWAQEKGAFMNGADAGFFVADQIGKKAFEVFNEWIFSLAGTEYVKSGGEPVYLTLGDTITFYSYLSKYSNGVYQDSPYGLELDVQWEGYKVIGATQFSLERDNSTVGFVSYQDINNPSIYRSRIVGMSYSRGWRDDGYFYSTPDRIYLDNEITNSSWYGYHDTLSNVGEIYTNNGDPVSADKSDVPITTEEVQTDVISQMPIGNPDNHDDKDNKKLTVIPNVPGLSGLDPLQLPGANGGRLPFNYPKPDPVTGQYPPISVKGNGGVTINIPVTNNDYKVINNYDQHSEYYNENYRYPTINYNYVNYYVNQGAMTYEQFLAALQEYFNVLVYNNTNNNYYPTTVNNNTNNYYNITEVINDRIPPILPPATISIADRFPFSIPFDLYKLLMLFNAEPHYWEWDVPVPTFQSGGTSNEFYHGEVGHFDFSSTVHISLEQWDIVALVLRTMLSILWSSFLYFLFWKFTHPN